MTDEPSRVLFGLRKGDLYIAIERGGAKFVLIHEQALGYRGGLRGGGLVYGELLDDRDGEPLGRGRRHGDRRSHDRPAEHADPHLVALANAGDTK